MKRFGAIAALVLVIVCGVGLRLVHLESEGPSVFPGGLYDDSVLKDESAKGFAARSKALFGEWSPSPADDYRFWEVLSPVWTWGQYGWFTIAGEGYKSARAWSVVWSALSMVFLYLALSPFSRRAGVIAAFFFAVNFSTLMFGRMGLLETQMSAWLILAFAAQVRAEKNSIHFLFAALFWLAAWMVKQSAVAYLPVLAAGYLLDLRRREKSRTAIETASLLLIAAAVIGLLLWPDYRIRSIMNLRHGLDYRPDATYMWMKVNPLRTVHSILYNLGPGFIKGYLAMFPVAGPLALAEIVLIGRELWQRKDPGRLRVLALAFWLSARLALTLQGQTFPRFYLIQAPSAIILAALLISRLGRPHLIAAAVLAVVLNLAPWISWVNKNPRELMRANEWMEATIGREAAVVAGEWAAPFCFDTGYRNFYLKSVFNRTGEQIEALGPTHVLVEEGKLDGENMDPAVRRLRKFFPSTWAARKELGRIRVFGGTPDETTVILYSIQLPSPVEDP